MVVDQQTVKHLVDNGHVISDKEVSEIAQDEKALTGNPVPAAGVLAGTSIFYDLTFRPSSNPFFTATAQSLRDKQQNFSTEEAEIEKKPQSDITKDDAKDIQSAESIANKNEKPLQSEVKDSVEKYKLSAPYLDKAFILMVYTVKRFR
ncbi:uncharacterized protein ColSpa_03054 [Colletotrichum spaethianum]|uniref:Uncharacterized protein n=1 Tax=Colletotrichum spaethianum TaxID=700344 RepID=A0AA37LAR2_9PEZI|nr:uncharacterized protein ColSpa_03054 [Colletotrichum spaethianum]GKT42873.1 hypothetical protein ColSpa_03054 [Colletotrichum spaethianum]